MTGNGMPDICGDKQFGGAASIGAREVNQAMNAPARDSSERRAVEKTDARTGNAHADGSRPSSNRHANAPRARYAAFVRSLTRNSEATQHCFYHGLPLLSAYRPRRHALAITISRVGAKSPCGVIDCAVRLQTAARGISPTTRSILPVRQIATMIATGSTSSRGSMPSVLIVSLSSRCHSAAIRWIIGHNDTNVTLDSILRRKDAINR